MSSFTPIEKIGVLQENFIQNAMKTNIPWAIGTQLLESSRNRYVPNRAEICDFTRIIQAGAGGILFAKETSATSDPSTVLNLATKIIEATNCNDSSEN